MCDDVGLKRINTTQGKGQIRDERCSAAYAAGFPEVEWCRDGWRRADRHLRVWEGWWLLYRAGRLGLLGEQRRGGAFQGVHRPFYGGVSQHPGHLHADARLQ